MSAPNAPVCDIESLILPDEDSSQLQAVLDELTVERGSPPVGRLGAGLQTPPADRPQVSRFSAVAATSESGAEATGGSLRSNPGTLPMSGPLQGFSPVPPAAQSSSPVDPRKAIADELASLCHARGIPLKPNTSTRRLFDGPPHVEYPEYPDDPETDASNMEFFND